MQKRKESDATHCGRKQKAHKKHNCPGSYQEKPEQRTLYVIMVIAHNKDFFLKEIWTNRSVKFFNYQSTIFIGLKSQAQEYSGKKKANENKSNMSK